MGLGRGSGALGVSEATWAGPGRAIPSREHAASATGPGLARSARQKAALGKPTLSPRHTLWGPISALWSFTQPAWGLVHMAAWSHPKTSPLPSSTSPHPAAAHETLPRPRPTGQCSELRSESPFKSHQVVVLSRATSRTQN